MDFKSWRFKFLTLVFFVLLGLFIFLLLLLLRMVLVVKVLLLVLMRRDVSVAARWVWVGTLVWRPPPVPSRPSPQSFRSWWSEGPADNSWSQHRPGSNWRHTVSYFHPFYVNLKTLPNYCPFPFYLGKYEHIFFFFEAFISLFIFLCPHLVCFRVDNSHRRFSPVQVFSCRAASTLSF